MLERKPGTVACTDVNLTGGPILREVASEVKIFPDGLMKRLEAAANGHLNPSELYARNFNRWQRNLCCCLAQLLDIA